MKHIIIMTAYKDVALINRILGEVPDDWDAYVHIDEKSTISLSKLDQRAFVLKKYNQLGGGKTIYWL